ncbi:MAG: PD-(D/E)XK nuclease family transposase, partial [Bacteroidales bacterium]
MKREIAQTEQKYVNLLHDWGFKMIFKREQHKHLLIAFLNDLLHGEKVINDITYKDSDLQSGIEAERNCSFDIYCTDQNEDIYLIEMQYTQQSFIFSRMVSYTSNLYVSGINKGVDWYKNISGVISICIMNF